jgi:hypothetical protein
MATTPQTGRRMQRMSDSILDLLEECRVLAITDKEDGTFEVEEACDYYFGVSLTRSQMLLLAHEIAELACSVTEALPTDTKTLENKG